jgi:hypothetical protein
MSTGFLVVSTFILSVLASNIATFTDSACKNAYKSLKVENGYPNGTCSPLASEGSFGSFQVVGLDIGCTGTYHTEWLTYAC